MPLVNPAVPLVNRGESTEEDRACYASFMADRTSRSEPTIDMTVDDANEEEFVANEGESLRPNFEAEDQFLRELEERHRLGLLETIQDTYMAFSDLLGQPNVLGKDDMYIPHSFTVHLAFAFFQRIDPFNLIIKHY